MRAILCHAYGPLDRLVLQDIPIPEPGHGEVRIEVKAAAVNFPDVLKVQGKYQSLPSFPFIPGAELSGIVSKVGPGVEGLMVGDMVAAYCGEGAFAEQVVAREDNCHLFAGDIDFGTASAFLVTYGTAYHALKDRGQVKPGESVVVLGAAGGVGLASIEIAKHMGARVIACASTQEKLDVCRDVGADYLINYTREDLKSSLKALTRGRGVDVVVDPVGGAYTEIAVRCLSYEGRHLVLGFTAGSIPRIPLNLSLLKVCSIVGVFWSRFMEEHPRKAYHNHQQLIEWVSSGVFQPRIDRRFTLDQAVQALQWIEGRSVIGKVVLEV